MWDLPRTTFHKDGAAKLLPFNVHQMLPQLVTNTNHPNIIIKCYHYCFKVFACKWFCRNTRSESCPFCRGSLKRIKSEDLWVLTGNEDVVDAEKVSKEDVSRFYLYITTLPKEYPDALFLVYYEFLIWTKLHQFLNTLTSKPTVKCKLHQYLFFFFFFIYIYIIYI